MLRFAKTFLAPILFGLLVQGCGESSTEPSEPSDPITSLPRQLTLAEVQVIDESNTFGFDLLKEVDGARADAKPNTIISPLSATMALGMALGSRSCSPAKSLRYSYRPAGW